MPASLTPQPRLVSYPWMSLDAWYGFHAGDAKIATQGEANVVFIDDSITQGWGGRGNEQWNERFASLRAVVLMSGTNNFAFAKDSPEVIAVVDQLERSYANADILLFGVFPRSEHPQDPIRSKIERTNRIIANLQVRERVDFLDIGDRFLEPDGRIHKTVMPDFLHLSEEGYRR